MRRIFTRRLFLAACLLAIAVGLLAAHEGQAAREKPARAGDLDARIRKLETTVADLLERMERIEAIKADVRDGGKLPSFASLVAGKATIIADDGTFLGTITTEAFNSKSIMNSVGRHGSTVGAESIFNDVSEQVREQF